ncbi:ABC transporter ATP-binding protein [candidate division KSB1 bacterium]
MSFLISIENLNIHFETEKGTVKAVNGVSFSIDEGEIFGIVGESGSGKTLTGLSIMGLLPRNKDTLVNGEIQYKSQNILRAPKQVIRKIRGSEISMIFQDPMSALNPVFTIGEQIAESFRINTNTGKSESKKKAVEILRLVGIPDSDERYNDYPHQLSGGMAQRAVIAIAISGNPSLLIADEPTANLDVTIQAQVLGLIMSLQKKLKMAVIIISHDFGVIAETTDRVAVMYAGKIQEMTGTDILLNNPLHPYTKGLLESIPRIDVDMPHLPAVPGSVPDPLNLPSGCTFHPRCSIGDEKCRIEEPVFEKKDTGHVVRCWRV